MVESEKMQEKCVAQGEVEERSQSVWWNDEVNAVVRRKEAAWKEVLAPCDQEARERYMEAYKEKIKGVYIRAKRK